MLIGTAGHIDHGKTSLVKRLTGRDTDRLPEEIKRGISIELGYAYVPVGAESADRLGFIDVPGHERFVHTMLAGATGIDYALLVVAADDGVMPQTDEHLDILLLLGIEQGAVALTKIDAVSPARVDEVRAQLAARTAGTAAATWPVYAVSSLSGEGVDELSRDLLVASRLPRARGDGRFRMAIDRCFTLSGVGTVVTGTVHSGLVRVGDHVAVAPGTHGKPLQSRVRSLHAQDRPAATGRAGERCALNLPGLEKSQIERGMWVQDEALANLTERVDASLRLSPRVAKALADGSTLHLHHGTADAMARIAVLDRARVEAGGEALVSFALDRPLAVARGDRFVIRDASAQRTIGGGRHAGRLGPPPWSTRTAAPGLSLTGARRQRQRGTQRLAGPAAGRGGATAVAVEPARRRARCAAGRQRSPRGRRHCLRRDALAAATRADACGGRAGPPARARTSGCRAAAAASSDRAGARCRCLRRHAR
jgi:selenocysteine-specific elongation factor